MIKRTFLLGEEWLYYKVYCGVRTADNILVELVAPLCQKLFENGLINSWFYIRYGDPDPHLRLRFKLTNTDNLVAVILEFNRLALPYMNDLLIWNIQTDTYVRELERYGSNTMELSEDLFFYESIFLLQTLSHIKNDELYFFFVLKAVDDFVSLFKMNESEKLKFYRSNATAYKNEFNVRKTTKMSLDKKYRASRELFFSIMSNKVSESIDKDLVSVLLHRNESIKPLANSLLKTYKSNTLEIELIDILTSYIHMFVNRAFRDRQRFYEMVVYDFLVRYQNSKLKRKAITQK